MLDVGLSSDFAPGVMTIVTVEGREIGILRWADKLYAVRNICPHIGAPVCTGPVQCHLEEKVPWDTDLIVHRDRPVVSCPWHHWEFDIATGNCVNGRERLRTYPVTVVDGRVLLDTRASVKRG